MRDKDKQQVGLMWDLIVKPGNVHEFRAPKCGRHKTVSGYFDNATALVTAAETWNGHANLYLTLNPVQPALIARSANSAKPYAENTTADADILWRRWLPVDLDACRPSGISASQEEHAQALDRAAKIRAFLAQRGIPSIFADSGNGGHLLIPIDLPNDDPSRVLVAGVLTALSALFDDAAVSVDVSCANAARIWKIYGTLACKGENMPDRPHRTAMILDYPEDLTPVSAARLQQIADLSPKPEVPTREQTAQANKPGRFELQSFLANNGLRVVSSEALSKYKRYKLEACPFNPDHRAPDSAVFEYPDGKLGFRCLHNSCADKHWRDVREHFEPNYRQEGTRYSGRPVQHGSKDDDMRDNSSDSFTSSVHSQTSFSDEALPAPLDAAALIGPAGDFVRIIEPHTESDSVAILVQMLVAFGSVIGRSAYFPVEASRHYLNMFAVMVGQSAKARKGTSLDHIRRLFLTLDEEWTNSRVMSGLSSGEGMLHAVRDPVYEEVQNKHKGEYSEGTMQVLKDAGEEDKRLLVTESEFARTLRVMEREGNTLSALLRDAWDTGKLRVLTKTPQKATDAHISICGHITRDELRQKLTSTEAANGFANRFLWVYVKRSKLLPRGGELHRVNMEPLLTRFRDAITFASSVQRMERDNETWNAWDQVYPDLTRDVSGLLGSVTSRAEAQVTRLSCLYALLDQSSTVRIQHLEAALSVWAYAEQSARYIFGDALGDPIADSILKALRNAPQGMTRTEINHLFGRNQRAERIALSLVLLQQHGLAGFKLVPTDGRPIEIWKAQGGPSI